MRVTSHLPKANSATTGTRRRLPDAPMGYDDSDSENNATSTNSRHTKRQKTTKPLTKAAANATSTTATTSTRGRRGQTAATAATTTPVKTQGRNQEHPPQTPFQSPGHLLRQQESPKTPYAVHKMMNMAETDEEIVRPVYETEALQITELCAFKVDHTAYNSYLYTGKMKVPMYSNIAREDYASSVGASAGKNIRVHLKPTSKAHLAFNLDSDCDDDDSSQSKQLKNRQTTNQKSKRLKPAVATTTSRVTTRGGADVCVVDDEPFGVQTRRGRRNTNTALSDWEFSLDDQDHEDFDSDDSENLDESDEDDEALQDEDRDEDGDVEDEDVEDEDVEDEDVEEEEDEGEEEDEEEEEEEEEAEESVEDSTEEEHTGRSNHRGPRGKTTTKALPKHSGKAKTRNPPLDSDEEVQLPNLPTRAANTARRNATNAKPIQNPKTISQNLNAIAGPQAKNQFSERMQPIPPTPAPTQNSNSNPSTTTPDEHKIVNIVVKYPLMGSLDDWKDSFQTCQEEVVMYRQIQTWKCPFLLRYYGTHGPGLVFEYVDGESLDSLLFHSSDVDIEAQTWMWSELGFHIATALLYLHKLNISHNDIKPENVRFSDSKQCWKLLDLGLATDFDMKVSRQIGTDGYRSPEVAQTGYLNRKSDVFSLGVMMDDALERLVARYQVLEDIYDEFEDIRVQYEHERKTKEYRHKGGKIDLDQEMQNVLTSYIKRRKVDSIPINLDNARYTMACGAKHVSFLEIARELIKAMLAEEPEKRPSVKRCLACFKTMMSIETQLRDCLATLKMMGVY